MGNSQTLVPHVGHSREACPREGGERESSAMLDFLDTRLRGYDAVVKNGVVMTTSSLVNWLIH